MKQAITALGIIALLVVLATIALYLAGQTAWAVGVGAFAIFLILGLLLTSTAVVTSWWSATLMQRGAELALTAQVSDDKRDGVLIGQVSNLTRDVLRLIQGTREQQQLPPPIPTRWLPKYPDSSPDEEVN